MKKLKLPVLLLLATTCSNAYSTDYYAVSTLFKGDDKVLDVINDSNDKKVRLKTKVAASGQYWTVTQYQDTEYYKLSTLFTPDKTLKFEKNNDGKRVLVLKTDKEGGNKRLWKLEQIGSTDYYKMKNKRRGDDECVDVVNNSSDYLPYLTSCKNVSGQYWKFTPR